MKLNQVITGCALAAGLMAVATSSQAGVVIGSTLFAPVTVKGKLTYVDGNKFKTMSFSTKDVLETLGYTDKGDQIATQVSGDFGGLYIVNDKSNQVITDLVDDGDAWVNVSSYLSTESDNNNSYKYSEQGYIDLGFYDYSGEYYSYVDFYGNYKASYSEKYNNNNPSYKANFKMDAKNIQAEQYDEETGDYLPGTGSVSAKGNGKLVYVE